MASPRKVTAARWQETRMVQNEWGVIVDHKDLLELRSLRTTSTMTDGGFMATLCLFAWEAEKARPKALFIDATEFTHTFGPGRTGRA
jgi:hypothetical protein